MKTRILVVDDEAPITRQLKKQLEATGDYEVLAENSGATAIQAAKTFKPDVALLDVMMPDLDGGELKFRLRQISGCEDLLVIFVTAAIEKNESNDKDIFLAKPIDVGEIIQCINKHLAKT